jgi:HJR/Mrr/RecB family endonuclease
MDMMTVVENYKDNLALLVCPNCGKFSKHKIIPVSNFASSYSVWAIDEPEYHCPLCWCHYNFCSTQNQAEWRGNYETTLFSSEYDISHFSDKVNKYLPISFLTASLDSTHKLILRAVNEELGTANTHTFNTAFGCLDEVVSYTVIDGKIDIDGLRLSPDAYIALKQKLEARYPEISAAIVTRVTELKAQAQEILLLPQTKELFNVFALNIALKLYCNYNIFSKVDCWFWFKYGHLEYLCNFDTYSRVPLLSQTVIKRESFPSSEIKQSITLSTIITEIEKDTFIEQYYKEKFDAFVEIIRERSNLRRSNASLVVYLALLKTVQNIIKETWKKNYALHFPDIQHMSLEECVIAYYGIESVDLKSDFFFSQFIHFLMANDKFDSNEIYQHNYEKTLKIATKIKEKKQASRDKEILLKSLLNPQSFSTKKLTINDIDLMSGVEFEHWIGHYFAQLAYTVTFTPMSGDQGIDVIIEKGGKRIGIQAKCYQGSVGNSAIQEATAGRAFYHLDKAMVITNSFFTFSAQQLAQANDVILWDRELLKEKLDS